MPGDKKQMSLLLWGIYEHALGGRSINAREKRSKLKIISVTQINMSNYMQQWASSLPNWTLPALSLFGVAVGGIMLFAVIIWTLVWKGLALWRAGRNGDKKWFVALLIINTLGILEILYLYVFSKKKSRENNAI